MSIVYINKDDNGFTRKIVADMSYLAVHRKLRLPRFQFEEGLYVLAGDEKFYLGREKIVKEDHDFYYFNFPYKISEVESI